MQVKSDPNELALGQSLAKQKQAEEISGPAISQRNSHAQEQEGELMDGSTGINTIAEEQPHPGNNNSPVTSSNSHANQKASTASVKSDSNVLDQDGSEFPPGEDRSNNNNFLKNGITHISNDGNLTDMLKDWENDFDEIFPNISDASPTATSETLSSGNVKSSTASAKARERKETKNSNNSMNSHPLSHSNAFPITTGLQQQANLGNAPPYPNSVAGGQMTPQVAPPMGIGPQIRRYLVNHIQGRGRQQMGPGSFPNMGGMPVRDNLIANPQTKNPETIAKVQEHLLIKKQQMQQRQMQQMVRQQMQQQMQQPYQQQTYQQQLIQMAQAAQQQQQQASPSPMMQSLSPHMQQQAFMQQNMNSPVPSPMSTTPHMNRNPFQFPHDYNAYMNQQKQMPAFDGMGNLQPPHDAESQMPMNFFPKQEPSPFSVRQQMPSQNNMHAMQPSPMRGMFPRDRMFQTDGMPPGQMMQGHLGPQQNFQSQVPKPPPPQYQQNNFSPPVVSLERQQLQRSMSTGRNRLSHFSHPEEMQNMTMQNNQTMKSPGSLPMYQAPENNMFSPMTGNIPPMGSMVQQRSTPSSVQLPDSSFANYQNYGPPNMNVGNPMSSNNTPLSPTNWADEGQMQKQHNMQQLRSSMNPDYRLPKGPSVNMVHRQQSMEQSRQMPVPFSPPVDKNSSDVSQLSSSTMVQSQQQKLPRTSLGSTFKQQPAPEKTRPSQITNDSDDLESLLSDPPENFDLVKNLLG